jgi:hypothetical protein
MSIFDYPRINFKGTIELNPGTANNDDYAGAVLLPQSWGPPWAGQTLALIDSKTVQAQTYGMSDEAFLAWAQKAQTFDVAGKPGQTQQIIPAEWNYYGGMESKTLAVTVTGVQTGSKNPPPAGLVGATLTFSGGITDVNSEGSPPATQFFMDSLTLANGSQTFIQGVPSKGACQWLNFYRNVNLTADAGAGGYVYHVIRKRKGAIIAIPGFESSNVTGVIFRYYLYRPLPETRSNAAIEALYKEGKTNAATLGITGTFAPLYADEEITTTPVGRLMVCNTTPIPTPPNSQNNGNNGYIALAPAVLHQKGNTLSADFVGTFPENYAGNPKAPDPKYDFGAVSLNVIAGSVNAPIGPVDYTNLAQGDAGGWIFDFDLASNQPAQQALKDPAAKFQLVSAQYGNVLAETDYYFVTNQQAIYTEQFGSGSEFLNQGTTEPFTVSAFSAGMKLTAADCPPITIWQYRSIPLQAPGNAVAISTSLKPGEPITIDTSQPGNFLFTFSIGTDGQPPPSYSTFMFPPWLTNSPSITLRILPNSEDFSKYYAPGEGEPVGNSLLTFGVLYEKVLRTYYLLYPAMNQVFPLNSETAVAKYAQAILDRTDQSLWMTTSYMPRTRDMSASRKQLLQAWCRKVMNAARAGRK